MAHEQEGVRFQTQVMGKIAGPLSGIGRAGLGEKLKVVKQGAPDCVRDLQWLVKHRNSWPLQELRRI